MNKLLLLLGIILLSACGTDKTETKEKEIIQENVALIIGDPMDCGLDSMLIFPVGSSYSPKIIEPEPGVEPDEEDVLSVEYSRNKTLTLASDNGSSNISFSVNSGSANMFDQLASIEYIVENNDDFDIRNLLFYNIYTGDYYPLILDSLHIISFAIHREYGEAMIFYRIVKRDNNGDEKFNSLDPVVLYISDLYGRDFTQITPDDEHFIDYEYLAETKSILITTVIDSNDDKDFANNDETNFRMMKIDNPKFAKSIFSKEFRDKLKTFY